MSGDLHRLEEDLTEHRIGVGGAIAVDRRDEARRVKGVQRLAEDVKGRVHLPLIVLLEVILDGEVGVKDLPRELGIGLRLPRALAGGEEG